MRFLSRGLLIAALLSAGCGGPTYKKENLAESVLKIARDEYKIDDIKVKIHDNTMWTYVPVEKLVGEKFQLNEDALNKVGDVSLISSRVIFSSDSDIKFMAMVAYDKMGIELKMIRHVEDVKKVRAWYIAYSDFMTRMDMKLEFNPEILGRRLVNNLMAELNKGTVHSKLKGYFISENNRDLADSLPEIAGTIEKIDTVRIEDKKALIHVKTSNPSGEYLFLIDVGFYDILKELLILYLSLKDNSAGKDEEGNTGTGVLGSEKRLKLPVIASFWDLGSDSWPEKYSKYGDVKKWPEQMYSMETDFNKFIAGQIERKIKKRFEDNRKKWDIKFDKLEVTYLRDEILVTRLADRPPKPRYAVDVDHEIAIAVERTIKNYELDDVRTLVISDPEWQERHVFSREEIMEFAPKKWKKLIKEPSEAWLALKQSILGMFVPGMAPAPQKTKDTGRQKTRSSTLYKP